MNTIMLKDKSENVPGILHRGTLRGTFRKKISPDANILAGSFVLNKVDKRWIEEIEGSF